MLSFVRAIVVMLAVVAVYGVSNSAEPPSKPKAKKWYEGGTLHKKSALDWQEASDEDKLATCADFVTKIWNDKGFTQKVQASMSSTEDRKPYSKKLVVFLDAATKKFPDATKNKQIYTNQKVAAMAIIGMNDLGWLKD